MLKKILFVLSIFLLTQNMFADEKEDVKNHLLGKIDEVISVVQNKSLNKDQRNEQIVKIVTPAFDFELMAKLSLGRVWRTLDGATREKFVELYVERMKKSYSEKLDTYTDQKVEVTKLSQPKGNRIIIETNLVSSTDKMDVIYKFYKPKKQLPKKDRWLVYDAEILGVSILKADKAQFSEFLKTKTISELMDTMAQGK